MISPLSDESVSEKRVELIEILKDLSQMSQDELIGNYLPDFASRFNRIYRDGYRQMYSELYPVLHEIRDEDPDDLDILCDNLENVRIYLRDAHGSESTEYSSELYGQVLKLSDHINLEIQRLIDSGEVRAEFDRLREEADNISFTVKTVDRKIQKVQTELVLILSIFASIIMLFSGSLSVLGNSISVLGEPHDVHELVMVFLLFGILLVDAISLLMGYVHRMIYVAGQNNHKHNLKESLAGNVPIIMLNVVLLLLLAIDLLLWFI